MRAEEKGSDVNLAIHLVNDAWKDVYDVALIISNDADLGGALNVVKNEQNKDIIIVNPFVWSKQSFARNLRNLNVPLRKIRELHLKLYQLPNRIPGTTIHKPDKW